MMNYETMKTQLTGDFRAVFDKAQTYLMTSQFPMQYQDDKMMELYDLLFTAQTEQKAPEKIVGRDSAAFVQNFFSDYESGWKTRLCCIADACRRMSIVVLVILFIDCMINLNAGTGFFASRTDVSMILAGVLGGIAFLIVNQYILRPASLKSRKIRNTGWAFIVLGLFIVLIPVEVILMHDIELRVPTAALLIATGAYLVGYYVIRSIWRLKTYGSLRDPQKAEKPDSYYTALPDRDLERICMKGMLKRYEQLARRGKITEDAFLEKMQREEKMSRYCDYVMIGCLLACTLPSVVKTACESTLFHTLFYIAVTGLCEFGIYKLFSGSLHKASAARMHIYACCKESGMTLPAYLESQMNAQ